jgi:hypothetical protein
MIQQYAANYSSLSSYALEYVEPYIHDIHSPPKEVLWPRRKFIPSEHSK